MATNLTKYLYNFSKSVTYSAIDAVKEMNPAINSFAETNEDTFKTAYQSIRHLKTTAKALGAKVMESEYGSASKTLLKNIKEDLTTGKFYNMERVQSSEQSAVNEMTDDSDIGFFDESGSSSDEFGDIFEDDDSASQKQFQDKIAKKASEAVGGVIVGSSEYVAASAHEDSKAIYGQSKAMYAMTHSGMKTINENIGKLIEISAGPITQHLENSKTFYETETKLSQDRNSILVEIRDAIKNQYQKQEDSSSSDRVTMSDVLDANGMVDLSQWGKAIANNIKTMSGPLTELLDIMKSGGGLEVFTANPLEFITKNLIKKAVPRVLEQSIQNFNTTLSGVFSTAMLKLSKADDDGILGNLKKLLHVEPDSHSVDLSKYEKGAVPFDGIVRKSIVEVIPTYLSEIASAVTKSQQKLYDFDKGVFKSVSQIKEDLNYESTSHIDRANGDIMSYFNAYLRKVNFGNGSDGEKRKDAFMQDLKSVLDTSFRRARLFNPKNKNDLDMRTYGLKGGKASEINFEIIKELFDKLPEKVKMSWATNYYEAHGDLAKRLRQREAEGSSIFNAMINGALNFNNIDTIEEAIEKANKNRYKRPGDSDNQILSDIRTYVADIKDLLKNGRPAVGSYNQVPNVNGPIITGGVTSQVNGIGIPKPTEIWTPNGNRTLHLDREWERKDFEHKYAVKSIENKRRKEEQKALKETDVVFGVSEDALDYDKLTKSAVHKELLSRLDKIDNNDPYGEYDPELESSLENKIYNLSDKRWYKLKLFHKKAKRIITKPADALAEIIGKADHALYDVFYGKEEGRYDANKGIKEIIVESFQDTFETAKTKISDILTDLGNLVDKDKRSKAIRRMKEKVGLVGEDGEWTLKELMFGKKTIDGHKLDNGFVQDALADFGHLFRKEIVRYEDTVKNAVNGLADVTGSSKELTEMARADRKRREYALSMGNAIRNSQLDRLKEQEEKEAKRKKEEENGEGEVENAASGMKRVKKTGVVAVSEGEMILPPDMNPFNADDREEKENKQKERYQKYFGNGNIPNFADGGNVSSGKDKVDSSLLIEILRDPDAFFSSKEFKKMPKDVQQNLLGSFASELGRIAKINNKKWDDSQRKSMNSYIGLAMNWWGNDSSVSDDIIESKKNFIIDLIMNQPELANIFFDSKTFEELSKSDKKEKYSDLAERRNALKLSDKKEDKKKVRRFDEFLAKNIKREFTKEDYVEGRDKNILTKSLGELANGIAGVFNHIHSSLKKDKDGNEVDEHKEQKIIATEVMKESKHFFPQMVAGGLVGTGVSLATSMIGGPLFGAAVGAGFSLVSNSKKVQKMLFGNEIVDEDGNKTRDGSGALSKDLTEKIFKYGPGMGKGAIAGAITAMLPFIPGGPVAGAIVGSAVSFASKNEKIHEYLFGEEGKLGKDTDKKIAEILPKMGAGAIAGLALGPFGVTTNLILGSAVGWASTTNKFKDIMFGEENKDGEREGGVIMAAYHGAIEPVVNFVKDQVSDLREWATEKIKKPLMDFVDPLKQGVKNMFRDISGGVKSIFNSFMEEHLGAPLDKFLKEKVFGKIGWVIKKIIGGALWAPKTMITAPAKLLGAVGRRATAGQIAEGKADNLTAEQRLAFMKANPNLRLGKRRTLEYANVRALDKGMADASLDQVESIQSQLKDLFAIDDTIKNGSKDAWQKYDKKIRRNKNISTKNLKVLRRLIDSAIKDGIFRAPEEVDQYIAKLNISREEKDEVRAIIDEYIAAKRIQIQDKKKLAKKKSEITKAIEKELGLKHTGHINEKNIMSFKRNIDKEVEAKRAFKEDPDSKKAMGISSLPDLNEEQKKRHEDMKKTIDSAIETLADRIASSFQKPVEELADAYQKEDQRDFEGWIAKNDKKIAKKKKKAEKKKYNKDQKKKDKKFHSANRDYRDMSKRRIMFKNPDGSVGYRTMTDEEFEERNRSMQDTVIIEGKKDENSWHVFNTREEILEMGYRPKDISPTDDGRFLLLPRNRKEMTREQAYRDGYMDDDFAAVIPYDPDHRQGFIRNVANKTLGKFVGKNGRVAGAGRLKNLAPSVPINMVKSAVRTGYRKANTAVENANFNEEEKSIGKYTRNGVKHLAKWSVPIVGQALLLRDIYRGAKHLGSKAGSKVNMSKDEFDALQEEAYNEYLENKNKNQEKLLPAVIPGEGVKDHPVEGVKQAVAKAAEANAEAIDNEEIEEDTKETKKEKKKRKNEEIISVMESDKELSEKRNDILGNIESLVNKIFNKEEPVDAKDEEPLEESKPEKSEDEETIVRAKKGQVIQLPDTQSGPVIQLPDTQASSGGIIGDVVSSMTAGVVDKTKKVSPSKKAIADTIDHEDSSTDGIAESEAMDQMKNNAQKSDDPISHIKKLEGVFGKLDEEAEQKEEKKPVFSFWKNKAIKFTKDKKGNMIPDRSSGDTKDAINDIEEDEKEESEARKALKEQPGFFKKLFFGDGRTKENGKQSVGLFGTIRNFFGGLTGAIFGDTGKKVLGLGLGIGGAVLGTPLLVGAIDKYIWNGGLKLKSLFTGFFGDDGTVSEGQKKAAGGIMSFLDRVWNGGEKKYVDENGQTQTVQCKGLKATLAETWSHGMDLITHFVMGEEEFKDGGLPKLLAKAVTSIGDLITKVAVPVVTELICNIPSIVSAIGKGIWNVLTNLWDRRPKWLGGDGYEGGAEAEKADKQFIDGTNDLEYSFLSVASDVPEDSKLSGVQSAVFNVSEKASKLFNNSNNNSSSSQGTTDPMFQNAGGQTNPQIANGLVVPDEIQDNTSTSSNQLQVPSSTAATAIANSNLVYGTEENPILAADTSQISQYAEHRGGLSNKGISGKGFTMNSSGTTYRPATITGLPEASSNGQVITTVSDGTIGSLQPPASNEEITKRNEAAIVFIKNNPLFKQLNSQIQGKMLNVIQGKYSDEPYIIEVTSSDNQVLYLTLGEFLCWEGEVCQYTDDNTGAQIPIHGTDLVDVYNYTGVLKEFGIDFALSEEEKSWGQASQRKDITVGSVLFEYGVRVLLCGRKSGLGFTFRLVAKVLRGTRKTLRLIPFGAFFARVGLGTAEKAFEGAGYVADKAENLAHSVSANTATRHAKADAKTLTRMGVLDEEIANQQKHIMRRQRANAAWGSKLSTDRFEEGITTLGEKRNELYDQLHTEKARDMGEYSAKGYDKSIKKEDFLSRKVDTATANGNAKTAGKYQELLDQQKETNSKLNPADILNKNSRSRNTIFDQASQKGAKLNLTDDVYDSLTKKSDLNNISFVGGGVDVKDLDNMTDAVTGKRNIIQRTSDAVSSAKSRVTDAASTAKSKLMDNKFMQKAAGAKDYVMEKATDVKDIISKKASDKISKMASKADGGKVAEFFKKATTKLKDVLSNDKVAKFTKKLFGGSEEEAVKTGAKIAEKVGQKLTKVVGDSAADKLAKLTSKIAASAASAGLLNVLLAVKDFIEGWSNANTILGVVDEVREPSLITKLICGVVNTVAGLFFITSLIPLDAVVDIVLAVCEAIPALAKLTKNIRSDREESQKIVDEYNEKHGTNYDIEEYNDKDKFTTKVKNKAKDFWLGEEERDENGKLTGKRSGGAWGAIKGAGKAIGSGVSKAWNWLTGGDDDKEDKKTSKKDKKKKDKKNSTLKSVKNAAMQKAQQVLNTAKQMQDIEPETVVDTASTSANADSNLTPGQEMYNTLNNNFAMTNNSINAGMQEINNNTLLAIGTTDKLMGSAFGFVDKKGNTLTLSEAAKYNWDADIKKGNNGTIYTALANALGLVTGKKGGKKTDTGFVIAKKDTTGSGTGLGTRMSGRGNASSSPDGTFISQTDSKYANKRFNTNSDTEKQTIGDSGCAPASAAMVVNSLTKDKLSMEDASTNALRYKDTNSGVTPDYFADEFSRHGIGTEYIGGDAKTRNNRIISNLAQGNRVVLMGQDINNKSKANSPFGSDGHYVVADGLSDDGKSIYVKDPEGKRSEIAYDVDKLLSGTKIGVSANVGMDPKDTVIPENLNMSPGSATQQKGFEFEVPSPDQYPKAGARHQYMGWQMITSKSSKQYKLIDAIGGAPTFDEEGLGRVGQRYAVAMKNYYGDAGDYLDITQTDGSVYKVVLADIKGTENGSTGMAKYAHGTDSSNYNMVEFVLDKNKFYPNGPNNPHAPSYHPAPGSSSFHPELGHDIVKITQAGNYWEDGIDNSPSFIDPTGTPVQPVNVAPLTGDNSTSGSDGEYTPSGDSSGEGKIGGLFADIKDAFHQLGVVFGLVSPDAKEEDGDGGNGDGSSDQFSSGEFSWNGQTITPEEKQVMQSALVGKMKSVEGTLKYGQENSKWPGTRDPDQGGGDCSSTVNWAYKKTLTKISDDGTSTPVDIGGYSGAQRTDDDTYTVSEGSVTEDGLELGDILLKPGHAAMYYGPGQIIEQGNPTSQPGPKVNPWKDGKFDLVRRWKGFHPDNIVEGEGGNVTNNNVNPETGDSGVLGENGAYNLTDGDGDGIVNVTLPTTPTPQNNTDNHDNTKNSGNKNGERKKQIEEALKFNEAQRQKYYHTSMGWKDVPWERDNSITQALSQTPSGTVQPSGSILLDGQPYKYDKKKGEDPNSGYIEGIWQNRYNNYFGKVFKWKTGENLNSKTPKYKDIIKARDAESSADRIKWVSNVKSRGRITDKPVNYTNFTRYIAKEVSQFKDVDMSKGKRPNKSIENLADTTSIQDSVSKMVGSGSGLSGKGSGLKDHLRNMPIEQPKEVKIPTQQINLSPGKVESKAPGTTNNNLSVKNETKITSDTSKEVLACMSSIITLLTKISSNTGKIGVVVELLTEWIQLEEKKNTIDKSTDSGKKQIQVINNKKADIIQSIKDNTSSGSADDALLQLMNSAALLANS